MKHVIKSNKSPISVDNLLQIEVFGSEIEVTTYGPRGGIHGFIFLDRGEFKSLLEDIIFDLSLYSYEERKELACKMIKMPCLTTEVKE